MFPTVAMAVGPGEIAYLAQLREVFEGVGVAPAMLVPRFGATWLPPEALALIEASGADPWRVVADTDAVLAELAAKRVPAELEGELLNAKAAALDGLTRFADASRALDASLPQMVESARGKVEYQFARLHEGLIGKVRARFDKEHPVWRRLRYSLSPGGKLQERRVASLEPGRAPGARRRRRTLRRGDRARGRRGAWRARTLAVGGLTHERGRTVLRGAPRRRRTHERGVGGHAGRARRTRRDRRPDAWRTRHARRRRDARA